MPPRNRRWAGYPHLLTARLLELKREPEIIFWVLDFPLLLALGLGIAFRNKPADVTPVAIVAGPGAEEALALLSLAVQFDLSTPTCRMKRRRCKVSGWGNTIW